MNAKGGRNSGETRRRKRDMKAKMKMILDMPVNNCGDFNMLSTLGIELSEIDNETLMLVGLFNKAKSGDVSAVKEIRSILGKDNASAELAIRKRELKLKEEAMQKNEPFCDEETPLLYKALGADENDV